MAPNTRNRQNTADPEHQDNGGETGGELMPGTGNTATAGHSHPPNPGPMPGFTAEQATSLQAFIAANNKVLLDQMRAMMEEMMDARLGPVQSTPPAPQEAPKEQAILEEDAEITAEKQEQQPLQQANAPQSNAPLYQTTMEDVEDDAEHGNSMTASKSMLSTKLRLCIAPTSRDAAACLSKALFSAHQHAFFLASLFGSFFGSFLASQFGYIRCMEGMEASGQG